MKKEDKKEVPRLRVLRSMRNLGWAFTAIGGGIIGLPGLDLLKSLAVYSIVVGTIISVGSQALINEIENREGDIGSSGGGSAWTVYKNENKN